MIIKKQNNPQNSQLKTLYSLMLYRVLLCAICKIFFLSFWWRPHRWLQSAWLGYKWFSRKMIKKTCAGRQSWAVGNSEFVMCNWQYELWLVTIYSVILHVLLSVNSGHAKYTSMAFFSKKNWWSWALGLHRVHILFIPSLYQYYQRNA